VTPLSTPDHSRSGVVLCESIEARLGSSVGDYDVEGIADEMSRDDVSCLLTEDEWDDLISSHAAEPEHRYPYNPNRF
jgi:hypothetical protein